MSVIKADISKKSRLQYVVGSSFVCRYGHIVDDGYAQKRLYIGIVRLSLKRIPKEDNDVYFPFRDMRPYLLISAERTAQKAVHIKPRSLAYKPRSRARSAKIMFL